MIYKFFKKLFPSEVSGTEKMDLNIKYVKEGIKKVAGKHFIKEEGDNIKIIPTGALNPFGVTFPIKNYRELNFKLSSQTDSVTNVEYSAVRKFSKSTSVIYTIFTISDLIAIAAIIYLLVTGEQEIAIYASMLAIPWIAITILSFLFDYFVILSEKAIKKSFSNNILKRVNKIGKIIEKA